SMVIWQWLPLGQSASLVQTQWGPQSMVPPHALLAQSESWLHALPTGALPLPPGALLEPQAPSPIITASAHLCLLPLPHMPATYHPRWRPTGSVQLAAGLVARGPVTRSSSSQEVPPGTWTQTAPRRSMLNSASLASTSAAMRTSPNQPSPQSRATTS